MKVAHLNFMREVPSGIIKQLRWEKKAGLGNNEWDTIAYHDAPAIDDIVKQIPWLFRNIFLRGMFAWYIILKLGSKYDYLLVRHITFDIYSIFFSSFIKNRITIHHSKEVEELKLIRDGWKGKFASSVEFFVGQRLLRKNKAILGVTNEIVNYEINRARMELPSFVYSNGISYSDITVLNDKRNAIVLNVFFICTSFAEWHGLDIVLKSIVNHKIYQDIMPINLHLVGRLNKSQISLIENDCFLSSVCKVYGVMEREDYTSILETCDIALGSFALYRKGLEEASTLKVREMLASGLPVVSGHKDLAFPENFLFYNNVGCDLNFKKLYVFFKKDIEYNRNKVSELSEEYISKEKIVKDVMSFLKSL